VPNALSQVNDMSSIKLMPVTEFKARNQVAVKVITSFIVVFSAANIKIGVNPIKLLFNFLSI